MKHLFHCFLVTWALVLWLPLAIADAAEIRPPNIVIVFMDDLGYADIAPFGGDIPTPHLDQLASEGRRFTNFAVTSAVCSASRAALLTGCYHRRVGISGALWPNADIGLHPDEETIADIVKKKNYATACFGKWHLGDHPEFWPLNQGFDEFFGIPYSNDMWPYHPEPNMARQFPPLRHIEGSNRLDEPITAEMQRNLTTWYTERAVQFIEKNKDKPFFLYVPHPMPHVPLFVSDKFEGKSGHGLYGDVIQEIDWSVGQIAETLRRLELGKNTLLIVTSDNGPWLSYGNHAGSSGPLREGKGTSFEGGVRVPTLFWWPGRIPANTACDQLAATIDILPTVAHLVGVPLPERKIDGKDIRPLIFGESGAKSPYDEANNAFAIYFNRQLQAVRDTRWKLVFPHQYRTMRGQTPGMDGLPRPYAQGSAAFALYDLENDIGEMRDVSSEHPGVVERLRAFADAIRAELGEGTEQGSGVRPAGSIAELRGAN
ncbi:MAG: sulfatase [Planctomycetaceae bacterium]|nr:sulfatase [Planctomycetaceae bacterium]